MLTRMATTAPARQRSQTDRKMRARLAILFVVAQPEPPSQAWKKRIRNAERSSHNRTLSVNVFQQLGHVSFFIDVRSAASRPSVPERRPFSNRGYGICNRGVLHQILMNRMLSIRHTRPVTEICLPCQVRFEHCCGSSTANGSGPFRLNHYVQKVRLLGITLAAFVL